MNNLSKEYKTPELNCVKILLEAGFTLSADSDFEQPEYGGEDNI